MKRLNDWIRAKTVRLLLGSVHLWALVVRAIVTHVFGIDISMMVLSLSDTSTERVYLGSDIYVVPEQRVYFLRAVSGIHDDLLRRWQAEQSAPGSEP